MREKGFGTGLIFKNLNIVIKLFWTVCSLPRKIILSFSNWTFSLNSKPQSIDHRLIEHISLSSVGYVFKKNEQQIHGLAMGVLWIIFSSFNISLLSHVWLRSVYPLIRLCRVAYGTLFTSARSSEGTPWGLGPWSAYFVVECVLLSLVGYIHIQYCLLFFSKFACDFLMFFFVYKLYYV